MKETRFEFLLDPDDSGNVERIQVRFKSRQPHTGASVVVVSAFGDRFIAVANAKLHPSDTWDLNAGMRVAFDHLIRNLEGLRRAGTVRVSAQFVKDLRRAGQVELAIDRVDREGKRLDAAIIRAGREHHALVAMRNRGYLSVEEFMRPVRRPIPVVEPKEELVVVEPTPEPVFPPVDGFFGGPRDGVELVIEGEVPWPRFDAEAAGRAEDAAYLRKPESYKNLLDSVPQKLDYTPSDQADGSGYEGDPWLPVNQTGR